MNTTVGFFRERMLKTCIALNKENRIKQRKERCFIQVLNDDEDDQDDDLIAP